MNTYREVELLVMNRFMSGGRTRTPEDRLRGYEYQVRELSRCVNYLNNKLLDLQDDDIYERYVGGDEPSFRLMPIVKKTAKLVQVEREPERYMSLPRQQIEAGEAVMLKKRGYSFDYLLGRIVRPLLSDQLASAIRQFGEAALRLEQVRSDVARGRVPLDADERRMADAFARDRGIMIPHADDGLARHDWRKVGF